MTKTQRSIPSAGFSKISKTIHGWPVFRGYDRRYDNAVIVLDDPFLKKLCKELKLPYSEGRVG